MPLIHQTSHHRLAAALMIGFTTLSSTAMADFSDA
jgi:hypothetical protein